MAIISVATVVSCRGAIAIDVCLKLAQFVWNTGERKGAVSRGRRHLHIEGGLFAPVKPDLRPGLDSFCVGQDKLARQA